jgi:very-short-patch-repair endonuclease
MICPICKQQLKNKNGWMNGHLQKHFNTKEEKYDFYLKHYYNISYNTLIDKYKKGEESAWTIVLKYKLHIREHLNNIVYRTPSESKKTTSYKRKYYQTIKKRYGVNNISQSPEIKDKKKQTCLRKYGVENNFINPDIRKKGIYALANRTKEQKEASRKKYIETLHRKYGPNINNVAQIPSIAKKISKHTKNRCKNMSCDEKAKMTQKARNTKMQNGCVSQIEKRVGDILKKYNKKYANNIPVGKYICDYIDEQNKKVLEVNGDMWHANPIVYKPNDIIPIINKQAKQIWEKDKKRKDYFTNRGYEYIVIWEKEIHKKPEEYIVNILKERQIL